MTINIYVQNDCVEKLYTFLKEGHETPEAIWSYNNFKGAVSVSLYYEEYLKLIDVSDKLDKETEEASITIEDTLGVEGSGWTKTDNVWRSYISEEPEVYFEYDTNIKCAKFIRDGINSYKNIEDLKDFEFFIERCMKIYND
jgi:hypothetical protein